MNNVGVYRILCVDTGKFYIGSSEELKKRKIYHWNRLRNNKHSNKHLQNAYNLYGESSMIWEILLFCSKENLLFEEQKQLDKYPFREILYNIATIAGASFRNKRHKKETREKIRVANSGQNHYFYGKHTAPEVKEKIRNQRYKYSIPLRKLTDEQVREARDLHSSENTTVKELASKYGVSQPTMKKILTRQRYANVV